MSAHRILQNFPRYSSLLRSQIKAVPRIPTVQKYQPVAFISTSKKTSDTTITAEQTTRISPKTVEDFANPKIIHQSYGFEDDPDWDINIRNYVMFITVTVAGCGLGYMMAYYPDKGMYEWTQREAYIELARREALGLPLVDPNLVPPENIHLPSDEELGDFEIII